jgi:hypothetical protein
MRYLVFKSILLGLFILSSMMVSYLRAECIKKVDHKRAVIFLDTNASFSEVEKAQEAACLRGERLIVMPGVKTSKRVWPYLKDVSYYEEMVSKYQCEHKDISKRNPKKCGKYQPELEVSKNRLDRFLKKNGTVDVDSFGQMAKSLANDGVAITTIIASGHDGGGNIDGVLGDISKVEIASVMNVAYMDRPDLKKQLRSVLMWGCYTATPAEVMYWRAVLPDLYMIAGFSSSGPLNTRESSGGLMKDLMLQTDEIITDYEGKKLLKKIRGVNYMLDALPALFVRTCSESEYYYHRTEDDVEGKIIKEGFGPFKDFLDCESEQLAFSTALGPYLDGDMEIPVNTSKTELRALYRKIRQRAHCFQELKQNYVTGDRTGLLLFFHEVKQIFADLFTDQINQARKELGELDFDQINRLLKEQKKELEAQLAGSTKEREILEDQIKRLNKTIGKFARDPALEAKLSFPDLATIKGRSRADLLKSISNLRNLVESYGLTWPMVRKRYGKLNKLYQLMQSHIYNLDPNCMNFLDWHKYDPKNLPKSKCP